MTALTESDPEQIVLGWLVSLAPPTYTAPTFPQKNPLPNDLMTLAPSPNRLKFALSRLNSSFSSETHEDAYRALDGKGRSFCQISADF